MKDPDFALGQCEAGPGDPPKAASAGDPLRTEAFLASLRSPHPEGLCSYGREALSLKVPIIREGTADVLRTLLCLSRPHSLLEVGTGTGYSSLVLLSYAPEGALLTTIEKDEERAALAREAFVRFGRQEQVRLLVGDATRILEGLTGSFDFVFMDAAKGQYAFWLPAVLSLMHPGSVLISDNVFLGGDIFSSRYLLPHRDRTMHGRMREYLRALYQEERLVTSVLPVGDGLAVSVWKEGAGNV